MKKSKLQEILRREIDKYASKSYKELTEISESIVYQGNEEGEFFQVEILLLENKMDYVHVGVSVDDGSFIRTTFWPVSSSFLVFSDGRVDK